MSPRSPEVRYFLDAYATRGGLMTADIAYRPTTSRPPRLCSTTSSPSGSDGVVASPDFAEQVRRAFHNLGAALAAHGLDLGHVVQLRTYVVGLDFDKLGAITQAVQADPHFTCVTVASEDSGISLCAGASIGSQIA